jgi:glutaredoxin
MIHTALAEVHELPILYVKPGCKTCEEITAFLDEHGIGYREIDITDRPSGRTEMEKKSGQSNAPVLDWHGRVLTCFNKDDLVPFLQSRDVKLEDS